MQIICHCHCTSFRKPTWLASLNDAVDLIDCVIERCVNKAVYWPDGCMSLIKVTVTACCVAFCFFFIPFNMQDTGLQYWGWDKSLLCFSSQCAACALWLIGDLHWCCDCAHEAQFARISVTDVLMVMARQLCSVFCKEVTLWHCGSLCSQGHKVPPVSSVLVRPCRLGTPIEPAETSV